MMFFESSVVPPDDPSRLTTPDEQVSARLSDERLERRERAIERARKKARNDRT